MASHGKTRYCSAAFCDGTEHLQRFPTDPYLREKWVRFLKIHQKEINLSADSRLCFRHFKPDDFSNYHQYRLMKDDKIRLRLIPGSIPSNARATQEDKTPRQKNFTPTPSKRQRKSIIRQLLNDNNDNDDSDEPTGKKVKQSTAGTSRQRNVDEERLDDLASPLGGDARISSVDSGEDVARVKPTSNSLANIRPGRISIATGRPVVMANSSTHMEHSFINQDKPRFRSEATQTESKITGIDGLRCTSKSLQIMSKPMETPIPSTTAATRALTFTTTLTSTTTTITTTNVTNVAMTTTTCTSTTSSAVTASILTSSKTIQKSPSKLSSSSPSTDSDSEEEWAADEDDAIKFDEEQVENSEVYKVRQCFFKEAKYIVTHDRLMELLQVCAKCAGNCDTTQHHEMGAMIAFNSTCVACGNTRIWQNSDVRERLPLINMSIASSILFAGLLPRKFLRALRFINLKVFSDRTFFNYQKGYLNGAIRHIYNNQQSELVSSIARPLTLNGDGRYDSPGHSAMYAVYSLMDAETSKIVSSCLIKCTEATSSAAMELEGLKRCREETTKLSLEVATLTTDQHISIKAYMRDHWPAVKHQFDTWHIAKGLQKKLAKLGNQKVGYRPILKWIPALVNHLYHVVGNTAPGELRRDWWMSAANHICDIHQHELVAFPRCIHADGEGEFTDEDGEVWFVDYIKPESMLDVEVRKILLNQRLLDAIGMASATSTSELEGFHSAINRNAPKMESFSYSGILSRIQLTIMHHNENCQRSIKLTAEGKPWRRVRRSKATKLIPTVQYVRADPTYKYIDELFQYLTKCVNDGVQPACPDHQPQTMASTAKPYHSLDELEKEMETRRRGLVRKPHYVNQQDDATSGGGRGRRNSGGRRGRRNSGGDRKQ